MNETTAIIEWQGVEYELKYSFNLIRRLKSEGLNVVKIYRELYNDPAAGSDYLDDVACIFAYLLKEAGCKDVTPETFYAHAVNNPLFTQTVYQLFMWVAVTHLTQSPNIPAPESKKKPVTKATTKKKAKKKKR